MLSFVLSCLASCTPPPGPQQIYREVLALRAKGDLDGALKRLEEALRISQRQKSDLYYKLLVEKGTILAQKGFSEAALTALETEPPATLALATVRIQRKLQQGYAHLLLSHPEMTRQLYEEAHAIAAEARLERDLARVELAQGTLLVRMGMPSEAEQRIRAANHRAQSLNEKALIIYGFETLGDALIVMARYEEAVIAINEELAAGGRENPGTRARAFTNQGWCYARMGQLDHAISLFQNAAEIERSIGSRYSEQVALGDLGAAYLDKHDFKGARAANERALAIAKDLKMIEWQSRWLTNLARVSIAARDWKHAAEFNSQAIELKKQTKNLKGIQYAIVDAARIAAGEGRLAEATGKFKSVLEESSDDPVPVLEAHEGLAEIYAQSGDDGRATAEFDAALRVAHGARGTLHADENKMNLFAGMMEVHQKYVDFLVTRGRFEQALEIAGASKAQLLRERVGLKKGDETLRAPAYRAIARAAGATLVSYWLGPKRSFAWIVSPDRITWEELPSRETIDGLVERYRATIQNLYDPLESEEPSGRELSKAVWAPVSKRIAPGSRVIIAPDGGLTAINFEALPVLAPKPHYLIEDITISVTPSLSLLARDRGESGPAKLLLIGNPDFASEQFPKLPYAGEEIRAVERHFKGQVTSLQHAAAVPAAYLKAPPKDFGFIHFTAHATANRESPLDSAIILDGPDGGNRLYVRDVLTQPLHAELVVVSACRSAGAKTYAGEGLVGFMWAFFQAGARNIIAGLWDVSDESTPQLMDDLYGGLRRGQGPAEALRAAKLKLMRSNRTFSLPYYWAPFQLYVREAGQKIARSSLR